MHFISFGSGFYSSIFDLMSEGLVIIESSSFDSAIYDSGFSFGSVSFLGQTLAIKDLEISSDL